MSRLPHTVARPLRALFVCSELFPLLKTGGLADVCAALPPALRATGMDVRVLLPAFPSVASGVHSPDASRLVCPGGQSGVGPAAHTAGPKGVWLNSAWSPAAVDAGAATPDLYLLHAPGLFGRPGNPYTDARGQPWADSAVRFAWLGWAAAQLALGLDPDWQPDVLHGHDWHAGLAPAYLNALAPSHTAHRPRPRTVFTVHNLAYQGLFEPHWLEPLGLPDALFTMHGLEFHGQISFMKAGLQFSDVLTTVSPTYAREITTPEQGCGLDGLLRERRAVLHGILNGVDDGVWDPATDPLLPQRYHADDLAGKAACKTAVQAEMGLCTDPESPLFVAISRLTEQKGLHVLAAVTDELVRLGGQLAILGAGDAAIESALNACAARHPGAVSVRVGYDETLAHRLVAGGDVILVPSRFEPCGLTQLYGLRYGTLPLVRAVGGLADTVTDCALENLDDGTATGFVFRHLDTEDLTRALRRALALRRRPEEWRAVQRRGMTRPLGWAAAAQAYRSLYDATPPTA